jgi:hypothetical protein
MNCKISLLHTSYNRPHIALNTFKNTVNKADVPQQIEYIIGLDNIDESIPEYKKLFNGIEEINKISKFELNIGNSTNTIQCSNRIIKNISDTTELILNASDDMEYIQSWDTKLLNTLRGVDNFKEPKFILISEGFYHTPEKYNTDFSKEEEYGYAFINRAFYNRLGYYVWPEYTHYGADTDLFAVAKILNAIVDARYILIKHEYYQQNPSHYDSTHHRKNNEKEWQTSFRVLAERKARNFDL